MNSGGGNNGGNGNGNGNDCPDYCWLDYGDYVEHKLNTRVFGMVIGREGSLLHVRLSPTLVVAKFHDVELRLLEDDEDFEPGEEDAGEEDERDNVIAFPGVLRADTPTKGVA